MTRPTRLAILGGTLLVLVAGTAIATQSARERPIVPAAASHEPEAPPSADEVAHALDRLKASGIAATEGQLSALAADYGLGGAIRLMAWADASGKSLADLRAMRDGGQGWGQIAHQLGLHPGIGSIMGGAGAQGADDAPGHSEDKPGGPPDAEDEQSPGS